MIFNTVQNSQKPHPAGSENTATPHFEIKIIEIPQEKLSNTAIPQTAMPPSEIQRENIKQFFFRAVFRVSPQVTGRLEEATN